MAPLLYMAAVAPTTFPRFMELPNEIQEVIWYNALMPPHESTRILTIGLPYRCENGRRYQEEDSLWIANRLKLVSKHTQRQMMEVTWLRRTFLSFDCASPSRHRLLKIKAPDTSGTGAEYLISDTQQDIFYFNKSFTTYHLDRVNAPREHTGWNQQPLLRPAHVMFNLKDVNSLIMWAASKSRKFLSFFGMPVLQRDQLVPPNSRDLRGYTTVRKITVVVHTGATEAFDGSNAKYSDLDCIPFDTTAPYAVTCSRVSPVQEDWSRYAELHIMLSHWGIMCTDAWMSESLEMPGLEFARV